MIFPRMQLSHAGHGSTTGTKEGTANHVSGTQGTNTIVHFSVGLPSFLPSLGSSMFLATKDLPSAAEAKAV